MAWEPIALTEAHIHAFATAAATLERGMDEQECALWREVIRRAGGNTAAGAPGTRAEDELLHMLQGIWEPGITIAPLYSGAMPREGGGTLD